MKLQILLLVLVVSACGPRAPVHFTTPCGMQIVGDGDGGWPEPLPPEEAALFKSRRSWKSPEDVARTEAEVLRVFDVVVVEDDRFKTNHACQALTGYQVYLHPKINFENNGKNVGGYTDCAAGMMMIGQSPPDQSSLGHEMAHAIQSCWATGPKNAADKGDDHRGFTDHKIYQAISMARAGDIP